MTRCASVLFLILLLTVESPAQSPSLTQRIDSLQMKGGHLPGAYKDNVLAAGTTWYFAQIGVWAVMLDGKHDNELRQFLDVYLATATRAGGAIDDVSDWTKVQTISWRVSDSDDSYAANILFLASWYADRPGGQAWFLSKLKQLKFIATANLIDNIDPLTRLPRVYNNQPGRAAQLGEKARYQKTSYLVDSCEAAHGLKHFAAKLQKLKDPDGERYAQVARNIEVGIRNLYDPKIEAFRYSPGDTSAPLFYPHRLAQIAPLVFGIDLGANTAAMNNNAWKYLNAGGDAWWQGQIKDGSNKGAPCMILAYGAALRGDHVRAKQMTTYFETTLAQMGTPGNTTKPIFANIDQLGWALLARRIEK